MKFDPRLSAAALLLILLAGCSTTSPRTTRPSSPAEAGAGVPPAASAPPPAISPTIGEQSRAPASLWTQMRARFAMPGCDADPGIAAWARRFTHSPRRFEGYLKHVMPVIAHIEDVAQKTDVPAEFSLLPWVESRYRAVVRRGNRPAGMWQIMPITARAMGLPVKRDYDGRLDRTASTQAIMVLLRGYDERWHDWRLADMAFNAGEYRIRRLHATGSAPAQPTIPALAVSRTTREHLTKLLAIACVIREPERFHVHLPTLDDSQRLQVIALAGPSTLNEIAGAAGLPFARVKALNGAYLHGRMPADGPWRVLLPRNAARRLHEAIAASRLPRQPATYTVAAGDSLWSIARHLDIGVAQLRQLNDLDGNVLHPGQILQIEATN